MTQQQNQDILNAKSGFNLLRILAGAHVTTITVFTHTGFGSEALGFRGLSAVILLWACLSFTGDEFYLNYLYAFIIALVIQRVTTFVKLSQGARIHSRSDGILWLAVWFPISSDLAAMLEPLLCFAASVGLAWLEDEGLYPLANWLFFGSLSLGFDWALHEMMLRKRVQAREDALLEMEEFQDRAERR
jgi:hypothetical protein